MKLWRTLLMGTLSLALLAGAVGCSPTETGGPTQGEQPGGNPSQGEQPGENPPQSGGEEKPLEDNSGMVYDKYDLKTYLYPYWEGNTVYNETLWFAGERTAPLMYTPDQILKVTSYDLQTEYKQDVDFTVDGKNIVLTDASSIPFMPEDEYITQTQNGMIGVPKEDEFGHTLGYVYASEGSAIISRQVVVTYTHSERGKWVKPTVQTEKISRAIEKLEAGERLKMVFYGDSITVGANSSEFVNYGPKAESYANMIKSYFARRYPAATIDFKNNAVGGTDSNWANDANMSNPTVDVMDGGQHFTKRVADEEPDLLFVAFGMNDGGYAPTQYEQNIRSVVRRAQEAKPDVEIVLISGMIANPGTPFNNKNYKMYEESLATIAGEFEHVAVARVWTNVNTVYETLGKRFQDCTANNANHPNDFMMRVYAQTILQTLFGEDYIDKI